jgi:diacylglycerol kinase (ATP)
MQQKIAFIINPKAGVRKKINFEDFIKANFSRTIPFDTIVWKDKDDFESIKQTILANNYTTVVACGGDGTVNQVASVLVNTPMALGILPLGSGNGLARSNGIPMDLQKALNTVSKGHTKKIDVGYFNSHPFFCTAGIGFDALIAYRFATSTKRGFSTYFKTTLKEFFSYSPNTYSITIDGNTINTKAFLITIANAGQWGSDVYIAPEAKLDDGILHVSVLKPFSILSVPAIAIKLFSKKIHTSNKLQTLTEKKIDITFDGELPTHFDGEPLISKNKLSIKVEPLALTIFC